MEKQHVFVWEPNPAKSKAVYNYFVKKTNEKDLSDKVEVYRSSYIGLTSSQPIIRILPSDTIYKGFEQEDLGEIFEAIVTGTEVDRFICEFDSKIATVPERDTHSKQFKVVLRNVGYINPENIDEYIARGGYKAMEKAIFEMTLSK